MNAGSSTLTVNTLDPHFHASQNLQAGAGVDQMHRCLTDVHAELSLQRGTQRIPATNNITAPAFGYGDVRRSPASSGPRVITTSTSPVAFSGSISSSLLQGSGTRSSRCRPPTLTTRRTAIHRERPTSHRSLRILASTMAAQPSGLRISFRRSARGLHPTDSSSIRVSSLNRVHRTTSHWAAI